jgi:uncharacterized protein
MRLARPAVLSLMTFAIAVGAGLAAAQDTTADVNRQLLNAVSKGDSASVRILLDNGANVEAKDANGSTPLVLAAERNDIAMVKLLLEKGAAAGAKDQQGDTALIQAARSGCTEVVGMLAEKTSDASEKEKALFAVLAGCGKIDAQRVFVSVSHR